MKRRIRLTENDIQKIVRNSVKRIIKEAADMESRKLITIDGQEMHVVVGRTADEWNMMYGNMRDSLCDFDFTELLDGAVEVNPDIWYWFIDGRCYETPEEVQ